MWVVFVQREVSRMFVNALQEYQSLVKANRRRCYCNSEPLSLQPTEGQFSFFFGEYSFAGDMPEKKPRFSSKSLCHVMHTKSENLQLFYLTFIGFITAFSRLSPACERICSDLLPTWNVRTEETQWDQLCVKALLFLI